ncbi:Viral coat protein (S domain) [Carpediemonas membranifera]|uniref:Viral coat protein (S domain) n=1 Tax=Carpediemonas membranifera TaxID=201153 RepID=A0A8J6B827_9EUKA|nr:Viral coat protein (S domain) [Carpediemonas membranifera]|eukprot:KAG9391962.1 Viral coat protein (S domain) [Carpediemonas membranifera]
MAYGARRNRRRSSRRPRRTRRGFTRRPRRTSRKRATSSRRFPFRRSVYRKTKIISPRSNGRLRMTFREVLFPVTARTDPAVHPAVDYRIYRDSRYQIQDAAITQAGGIYRSGMGHHPFTVGNVFNRLDALSKNFDRYKIVSAHLVYQPEESPQGAGTITIMWEPNPLEPVPVDPTRMLQNECSASGPCWSSWSLPVPVRSSSKSTNPQFTNAPDRGTDNGQFVYASSATRPTPDLLGRFWIEYTVEFSMPSAEKTIASYLSPST